MSMPYDLRVSVLGLLSPQIPGSSECLKTPDLDPSSLTRERNAQYCIPAASQNLPDPASSTKLLVAGGGGSRSHESGCQNQPCQFHLASNHKVSKSQSRGWLEIPVATHFPGGQGKWNFPRVNCPLSGWTTPSFPMAVSPEEQPYLLQQRFQHQHGLEHLPECRTVEIQNKSRTIQSMRNGGVCVCVFVGVGVDLL